MSDPIPREELVSSFGEDRELCQYCLKEPATFDPILGVRICAPCLNQLGSDDA